MPRAQRIPSPPWTLDEARIARFRKRLFAWFSREKRDLPWRRTRDPYGIWISEIMLQQTRVAAVIPYYERFLRRFPSVGALARARTETVLQFWAGLGYYNRARNMHAAAKQIVAQDGGKFPNTLNGALELPGIGRYTAAAVLSIAYGVPLAVLDGNVARVLARLGAIRGDLRAPERWRELERAADTMLATRAAGDWNEAMMELGATVCTPRAPRCEECPMEAECRARALGIEDELPAKRVKRATVKLTLAAAVLLDPRGRTLLVRHSKSSAKTESTELFSKLWQFPAAVIKGDAKAQLTKVVRALVEKKPRALKMETTPLTRATHTVTFCKITLAPYLIRVERLPDTVGEAARIVPLAEVANLAVSSATRKIAAAAMNHTD